MEIFSVISFIILSSVVLFFLCKNFKAIEVRTIIVAAGEWFVELPDRIEALFGYLLKKRIYSGGSRGRVSGSGPPPPPQPPYQTCGYFCFHRYP